MINNNDPVRESIVSILEIRLLRIIPSIYLLSGHVPGVGPRGGMISKHMYKYKIHWILVSDMKKVKPRQGRESKGVGCQG